MKYPSRGLGEDVKALTTIGLQTSALVKCKVKRTDK